MTFLSQEIYDFYQISELNFEENCNEYILDDLTINWDKISSQFLDCNSDKFVINNQNEFWFKQKIYLVHKIMYESLRTIKNCPKNVLLKKCEWMNQSLNLIKSYEYFCSNKDQNLLKSVLILTSTMERSLGNIYRVHNKNVPFLLKELLETKYLYKLLGNSPVRLMQILFGTAKALNIRNIAWHGFFSQNEVKQIHVAILFIIITSLGAILSKNNINFVLERPQITNIDQKLSDIENRNKFITIFDSELNETIRNSIGNTQLVFWDEILSHGPKNCQNNCPILLMPIFEHLLRQIICKLNNCEDRNLTAMSKEKYLTLDYIFDHFEGNNIFKIVNNGLYDFYQDFFVHLSGLRIRDKLSHGEIELSCISCRLTNILLNFILCIVVKTNIYLNITTDTGLFIKLNQNFDNYERLYHTNTILKYKILSNFENLQNLLDIPKPNEKDLIKSEIIIEKYNFDAIIDRNIKQIHNPEVFMKNIKMPTGNRPKNEIKLVKFLTKISEKISEISNQIIENNEKRYQHFMNKTLSLRQINKYNEILQSVSIIQNALYCILIIIINIMNGQLSQEDFEYPIEVFRFLRDTQKYLDKILRFSNVKINNWSKVRDLTTECETRLNFVFNKHFK